MAIKRPLVIGADGLTQQLQAGDTLDVPASGANTLALTNNEAGAVVIGAPVYASASGAVRKAQANAAATSRVVGLVYEPSIAATASGQICTDGILTATTTQWDAVTGGTGGLTFGALYFLDAAAPGLLKTVPPTTTGQYLVAVGVALSSTVLDVTIEREIKL